MRRNLSYILQFVILLTVMFTVNACSAGTTHIDEAARNAVFQTKDITEEDMMHSGDYTYIMSEDGEYVAIISYTGTEKEVKIPSKLDGKPVIALKGQYVSFDRGVGIDYVFDNANTIESVVIPDSILFLDNAFFACKNLNNVTLPRNLLRVSSGFGGCEKLKNVELPDTLEEIGEYTFERCSSLTEINIPESLKVIGKSAFNGCSSLERISFPASLKSIDSEAFSGCSSLKEVVFSTESLTLGSYAFSDCTSLEKAEFSSVAELPNGVFYGCTALKTFTFPEGLEYIGESAFRGCTGLTEITLPSSLLFIDAEAFSECTNLTDIHLSHNTLLNEEVYNNAYLDDEYFSSSIFGKSANVPQLLYYDEINEKQDSNIAEISEPNYIVEDLEGYTLRIFDIGSVDDRYYSMFDDESFKTVIDIVSAKYNCSIVEVDSEDWYNELKTSTLRGESSPFDIAIIPSDMVLSCASESLIIPWEGDLSADWWDQSANQRYNIGGVQLAVSGDFNINNFASQMCYVYNREKLDANSERFSNVLVDDANNGWGDNGELCNYNYRCDYTYNGGICASTFDYYRTMLAGQGVNFYSVADDGTISLSYGNGSGYINLIDGMAEDPALDLFRYSMSLYSVREDIIKVLEQDLMTESVNLSGMADFLSCDDSLFSDETSTFKIVRLDEVPVLRETGMDIGLVTLPGCFYTSLVDTPTLAVQPLLTSDTYKNYIILGALAKYSQSEMLPEFTKSIIGDKPEANAQENSSTDEDSTYSYNKQMIRKIFENPYYELDFGETGKELQYLYYRYMLRYDATYLWSGGKISESKFNSAVFNQMRYIKNVSSKMNDLHEYYSSIGDTAETVESVPKETWAEEYFNIFANADSDIDIIDHVLDITKISTVYNRNGGGSFYDALLDAVILNDILSAYQKITDNGSTIYDKYYSYNEFAEQSDMSEEENAIIRRFFYVGEACRYPLSYVQEALDYLYGEGTFKAEEFSNVMSFYVTKDRQYLYLQIPRTFSGSYLNNEYEYTYYKLMNTQYLDKFIGEQETDSGAVIEMIVVGVSRKEKNYCAYDYVTNALLGVEDGFGEDNAQAIATIENHFPTKFYASGRVKLFLKKDSTGVHIMGIKTGLPYN